MHAQFRTFVAYYDDFAFCIIQNWNLLLESH